VTSTHGSESSYLVVLNADPRMVEFQERFEHGAEVLAS
jgi:hypothetical protein